MILVADEQQIPPRLIGRRRDAWDAPEDGALKIQFQHHAERASKSRIEADREVQRDDLSGFEKLLQWRQRRAVLLPVLRGRRVRRFRRTEGARDDRVVVE